MNPSGAAAFKSRRQKQELDGQTVRLIESCSDKTKLILFLSERSKPSEPSMGWEGDQARHHSLKTVTSQRGEAAQRVAKPVHLAGRLIYHEVVPYGQLARLKLAIEEEGPELGRRFRRGNARPGSDSSETWREVLLERPRSAEMAKGSTQHRISIFKPFPRIGKLPGW